MNTSKAKKNAKIRLVCAWCGISLQPGVAAERTDIISHGICPACRKRFFSKRHKIKNS